MATDRQKLIHLHGSARLTNPAKLNTGEIAVTHAADNKEVELAVLNNGGGLVYIPSRDYIDTAIAGVQSIANEAATKSELTAATQTLEGEINDKVAQTEYNAYTAATDSSISEIEKDVEGLGTRMTTAEGNIEALQTTVDGDEDNVGLVQKVAALEEAVGNSDGNSLGSRVEALEGTVDDTTSGVKANAANISALQTAVNTINNTTIPTLVNKDDVNPGAVASTGGAHVDVTVTQEAGKIVAVSVAEDFDSITDAISGLDSKVNTLIGGDTGKSVRSISAEEVAKVVADAPESFDTLKEIADWIGNDTTGAATMANDIAELKGTVDGYSSTNTIKSAIEAVSSVANKAATKSELTAATQTLEGEINDKVAQTEYNAYTAATDSSISGLSGRVDGVESTASSALAKANSAVQKADADGTVASVGDTKVKVTVTQTEGKITAVSVVEDFSSLATAAALSAVETKANGAVQDVAISGLTGVSKSESDGVVTFDFSKITINCGTYDEE